MVIRYGLQDCRSCKVWGYRVRVTTTRVLRVGDSRYLADRKFGSLIHK